MDCEKKILIVYREVLSHAGCISSIRKPVTVMVEVMISSVSCLIAVLLMKPYVRFFIT